MSGKLTPDTRNLISEIIMHQSSLEKMRIFKEKYLDPKHGASLRIIDLGSQDINGSYRPLFDEDRWTYEGDDMSPGKNVDIVLKNPYHWQEVESNTYDVLISGQAFEHIEYFWITMLEVVRVLKPGGVCCLVAPSGGPEHRYPLDCWRFYADGFSALARFSGMEVLEVFTDWQPKKGYTDDSSDWKDTVLVGRKPELSLIRRWRERVRRRLLQWGLE